MATCRGVRTRHLASRKLFPMIYHNRNPNRPPTEVLLSPRRDKEVERFPHSAPSKAAQGQNPVTLAGAAASGGGTLWGQTCPTNGSDPHSLAQEGRWFGASTGVVSKGSLSHRHRTSTSGPSRSPGHSVWGQSLRVHSQPAWPHLHTAGVVFDQPCGTTSLFLHSYPATRLVCPTS